MSSFVVDIENFRKEALKNFARDDKILTLIPLKWVDSLNLTPLLEFLNFLKNDPLKFEDSLLMFFDGFNDDERSIYEIPKVREFYKEVVNEFPYLLLFLNRKRLEGQPDFELFFLLLLPLKELKPKIGGSYYEIDASKTEVLLETSLVAVHQLFEEHKIAAGYYNSAVANINESFNTMLKWGY